MKNRICELRAEKNVSQKELADCLSVSRAALSGYETGKYEADMETYFKIADYFDVSLDYLFCRTNRRNMPRNGEDVMKESQLLEKYHSLNEEGQATVINMMNGLIASGAYIKTTGIRQIQVS